MGIWFYKDLIEQLLAAQDKQLRKLSQVQQI